MKDTIQKVQTVGDYLIGTSNHALFIACMIIALATATYKVHLETKKGKLLNPTSPDSFDWGYFWKDGNIGRIIGSGFGIYLLVRFMGYLYNTNFMVKAEVPDETQLFLSMLIGFGSDAGINKLRQLGWFGGAAGVSSKTEQPPNQQ